MPESLLATVQQVRARYGAAPSDDECGAIVNEVAWIHRADGWGLSAKPSGASAAQPGTGVRIARDILHHRPSNEIFDCLVDAGDGGPASPSWQARGVITDASRPWVAPVGTGIDLGGGGAPGGSGLEPIEVNIDLPETLAAIAGLHEELAGLRQDLQQAIRDLRANPPIVKLRW